MITESTGARTDTSTNTSTHTRTKVRTGRRSGRVRTAMAVSGVFARFGAFVGTARREIAQTVTPAGWVVVVVSAAGLAVGITLGWSEWIAAGFVALILLVLSLPFLFGARSYDVSVAVASDHVTAGGSVPTTVVVRNKSSRLALPGRLDLPVGKGLIEIPVPMLRGGAETQTPLEIPTARRGIVTVGPATAVRSDPVGLLRRENEWADKYDIYVQPQITQVPSTSSGMIRDLEGNPTSRLVDSDMSFHAIREYAPGDSRRQVHWKSTAKTGKLMVRQYEESRRSRMAIALSVAVNDYAGEDEYELAVSASASLGVQALRDGRDLDITVGAAIPRVVRGRLRAVRQLGALSPRTLLDEFCVVDSLESTMQIEDVCALQAEEADGLSIAFIVCGSKTGLERARRAALAYSPNTSVVAVVCDEAAQPRMRPFGDITVMTIGLLGDLPALIARGLRR